jgi:ADP-dependent NAD(P)H-hydrate dehydratase / NAD(P)H-hydrate epimerase
VRSMLRVVSIGEMKEIEKVCADKFHYDENLIIENVGVRGADYLFQSYLKEHDFGEIVVLVGSGNNGSDALAIARNLRNKGLAVRAFILFPDNKMETGFSHQLKMCKSFGVKISDIREIDSLRAYFNESQDEYFVIDGILGTGYRAPLSNYLFEVITLVNECASKIIAIDIPSGVEGDSGAVSSASILAYETLAVQVPKIGHFIAQGAQRSGKLHIIEAGFPREALRGGDISLLAPSRVAHVIPWRNKFSHKNRFGHVLVIGGSKGLTGALQMSAESALKSGAGLVSAITWEDCYSELIAGVIPEVMTGIIPKDPALIEKGIYSLEKFDTIVIGPGLGRSKLSREIVLKVLSYFKGPIVVDADAIRLLSFSKDLELLRERKGLTVFTPHLGEFSGFLEKSLEEIGENPIHHLKEAVGETGCSFIVKSACTFLAFPNGNIFVNYFPNDGMATGGSGDVLAGILGGTLAQHLPKPTTSKLFRKNDPLYDATSFAVLVHTLAGKHAAKNLGERFMTARSITNHLPQAFFELEEISRKLKYNKK